MEDGVEDTNESQEDIDHQPSPSTESRDSNMKKRLSTNKSQPNNNNNSHSDNTNKPSSSTKSCSVKKKAAPTKNPSAPSGTTPTELQQKPSALEAHLKLLEEEIAPAVEVKENYFAVEKAIVPTLDLPNMLFFGDPNCSMYWHWVVHIDWPVWERKLATEFEDIPKTLGICKIIKNMATYTNVGDMTALDSAHTPRAKDKAMRDKYANLSRYIVIYAVCFAAKDKSLDEAVLLCGQQKMSNIKQHKDKWHKDSPLEDPNSRQSSSQTTLASYRIQNTSKSQATGDLQKLIYRFVNDCNLPAITVEKKPSFSDLLRYAINNASALKDTPAEVISRRQITKLRIHSYQVFFGLISDLVNHCRNEFVRLCYRKVPFITVCHDIWQAKKYDVLGVTIMFTDPRNCVVYRIPIGPAECQGHGATDVANLTDSLLIGVGITRDDLCASVNDNTTAAVLAGKYIIGHPRKARKCDMHKTELVLKHAT